MRFILEPTQNEDCSNWWEIGAHTSKGYKVYNFSGGFHYITEEEYNKYQKIDVEHWYNLPDYKCPFLTNRLKKEIWIDTDGNVYGSDDAGHTAIADSVCEFYEWDKNTFHSAFDTDEILETLGWIRISYMFWDYHLRDKSVWEMNQKQADKLFDWCNKYKKTYPKNIVEIVTT